MYHHCSKPAYGICFKSIFFMRLMMTTNIQRFLNENQQRYFHQAKNSLAESKDRLKSTWQRLESGFDDQEGKLGLSDLENKLRCFLESVNNESQVNKQVGLFPLDEDIASQRVPSRYNDLCRQTINSVLSEISQFKRRSPTSIADCDFSTVNTETSSTPIAIPLRTIHSAEDFSSYDLDLLNAVDLACRRMTYLESVQGYVEDQDFPGNDQFPRNFSLLSQRVFFSGSGPSELLVEASGNDMPISVTSRG